MFNLEDIVQIDLNHYNGIAFFPSQVTHSTDAMIIGLYNAGDKAKDAALVVELNSNYLQRLCSVLTTNMVASFSYNSGYKFSRNISSFVNKNVAWLATSVLTLKTQAPLSSEITAPQKISFENGANCKLCNYFNPYAESNQSDGSYVCFNCRV